MALWSLACDRHIENSSAPHSQVLWPSTSLGKWVFKCRSMLFILERCHMPHHQPEGWATPSNSSTAPIHGFLVRRRGFRQGRELIGLTCSLAHKPVRVWKAFLGETLGSNLI